MSHFLYAALRRFMLAGIVLLGFGLWSQGAHAQSCNDDLAAMGKERNNEIVALNAISKAHGNKLDPIAACPHLRKMRDIEAKMSAYLVKNKDWCNIPEDFIANFKSGSEHTGQIAKQACDLAEKAKKMQENGGPVGNLPPPPKLPAGPL